MDLEQEQKRNPYLNTKEFKEINNEEKVFVDFHDSSTHRCFIFPCPVFSHQ